VLRLSTDEQQEVREDPAVQSVMRLFEGDLNHIQPDKTIQSSKDNAIDEMEEADDE
jgi:hypothetical protein